VQISPVNAGETAADYAVDLAEPAARDQSAQPLAGRQRLRRWQAALAGPVAWPVAVYAASRLLLLLVTAVLALAGQPFTREPFRFDARWYLLLAERGYPTVPLHAKSTLGFFPLYPLVLRGLGWLLLLPVPLAALVTSFLGGLVAAVLAQRLATGWWGEQTARRVTLIFCLFPGAIVFSMAYSECLTIPLALGCLLALRSKRWVLAGLLAGLATAVEPVAVVLVVVCLAAALRELRSAGWRDRDALRSLAAPLLAPLGLAALAVFLWAWTGTPFAIYLAQHYGWHQQNQPLALAGLPVARRILSDHAHLLMHFLTPNIVDGVLGAVFLGFSLRELIRYRRELTVGGLLLPAGIAAVTLWSILTPPNPRMLLIAVPAVMIWGRRLSGRSFAVFASVEVVLLIATSALTFSGHMLP
jgi:Mannosyltransferase (PIG-V)